MIYINTKKSFESTTLHVCRWIESANGKYILGVGELFGHDIHLTYRLGNSTLSTSISVGERAFNVDDIDVVWFRRDGTAEAEQRDMTTDEKHRAAISKNYFTELREAKLTFYNSLKNKKFLTRPYSREMNKLEVLDIARKIGLRIPMTLITSRKEDLVNFLEDVGSLLITKPIYNGDFFYLGDKAFAIYTEVLSENEIRSLPPTFFPALFQEQIPKEYEIRVFYLDGKCYCMAIFSQDDEQTSVDFRRYNKRDPNRNVPYRLPAEIENRIINLMNRLELKTGSIDIIKSSSGEYVFLEVNAVGQFGMVSHPCNYYLEKSVADFLITNDIPNEQESEV